MLHFHCLLKKYILCPERDLTVISVVGNVITMNDLMKNSIEGKLLFVQLVFLDAQYLFMQSHNFQN